MFASEMIGARAARLFMPYNLHRCKDTRDVFLFLNRNYEPIGTIGFQGYNFDDHPSRVRIKGLTDARAERAGLEVTEAGYFFYGDGSKPWASAASWDRYQQILGRVMSWRIEVVAQAVRPGLDYLHRPGAARAGQ